ncbi:uncharacterized protein LOC141915459 [Tubulanus polymorphus]|uniref:uncharacterized protein LOC141915459 n=1 Tax=Tubulanus polymorphus TaxID=672921 RepID=UPI003DA4EC52
MSFRLEVITMSTSISHPSTAIDKRKAEVAGVTFYSLDVIITFFIIAPLVVSYWRGTWELMDHYLPREAPLNCFISYGIGVCLVMIFNLLQFKLEKCLHGQNVILFIICSRVYLYVLSGAIVNHWRGVWTLWDHYTGTGALSGMTSTIIGFAMLALFRGAKNAYAPPLLSVIDRHDNFFVISTRFRRTPKTPYNWFLDILFTTVVIHGLVVFVWRGSWVFLDAILYPDDKTKSSWVSLIIGYLICFIYVFWQKLAAIISRKLASKTIWLSIFESVYWIIGIHGSLNVWRGVWGLLNVFLLPGREPMSQWITHSMGVSLMFIGSYKSILPYGFALDGEGVTLPISYIQEMINRKSSPICTRTNGGRNGQKVADIDVIDVLMKDASSIEMEDL